jgi:hypothetical protein
MLTILIGMALAPIGFGASTTMMILVRAGLAHGSTADDCPKQAASRPAVIPTRSAT